MTSKTPNTINILIAGAGQAAALLAEDIAGSEQSPFRVIGYVDDDKAKHGTVIGGFPVLGTLKDLRKVITAHDVEEIFIAIPSERGQVVRDIVEQTSGLGVVYKILPRLSEVLMQDFSEDYLRYIRRVRPEDLLGGEISKASQQEITDFAAGQTILVTGAAGSIGSELSRQIAAHNPARVVLYDWWENGMYDLRLQLLAASPDVDFEFIIGDIKDRRKLGHVMRTFRPTSVFHAAAYKHVPLMEANASEAIKNNIFGTKTVAELAIKHGVQKFVLVSTDKAVNPTNIMGATKRAAEQLLHVLAQSQNVTTFSAVRFGNVINSNGSVIPLFQQQIEQGGPVTVMHKEITRFFMTIPEATNLILQAWVAGENDDLFVLDMGEPVKIYDLARLLISLAGYEPDKDIKINIVGLRPGEKLYEEVLVSQETTKATKSKKIFKTTNYHDFDQLTFLNDLNLLKEALDEEELDIVSLKRRMKELVATYQPASFKE